MVLRAFLHSEGNQQIAFAIGALRRYLNAAKARGLVHTLQILGALTHQLLTVFAVRKQVRFPHRDLGD